MMIKKILLLAAVLSLALGLLPAHAVSHYIPRQGDYFHYSDVINLNNSTGAWYGYTEHETISGIERVNTVNSTGTIASNYTQTWNWSNSSGSTQSGNPAGNFTWSYNTYQYVKGNDSQTGYLKPLYVWFYMANTTLQTGTWWFLNTQMTVTSTHYNYLLTSHGNVWTIRSTGTGGYPRDYGGILFQAAYNYTIYSDPSTGYIVGYAYVEQDTSSRASFTSSESLYVTSTSYPLSSAPATLPPSNPTLQYLGYVAIGVVVLLIIILIAILAYALSRRRRNRLPKHVSFPQVPQQYPQQQPPQINLTPKEPPVQQIVVKEIVKVKCRYCGALIDGTLPTCPFCGAPRS